MAFLCFVVLFSFQMESLERENALFLEFYEDAILEFESFGELVQFKVSIFVVVVIYFSLLTICVV
jgi:hypothetical protein